MVTPCKSEGRGSQQVLASPGFFGTLARTPAARGFRQALGRVPGLPATAGGSNSYTPTRGAASAAAPRAAAPVEWALDAGRRLVMQSCLVLLQLVAFASRRDQACILSRVFLQISV